MFEEEEEEDQRSDTWPLFASRRRISPRSLRLIFGGEGSRRTLAMR